MRPLRYRHVGLLISTALDRRLIFVEGAVVTK
jgi:hypothetical protein